MKRIRSKSSNWIIDEELKKFIRLPLEEAHVEHPRVAYHLGWEEYEEFWEFENGIFGVKLSDGRYLTSVRAAEVHMDTDKTTSIPRRGRFDNNSVKSDH